MGCRLWGRTESDTTVATQQQQKEQWAENKGAGVRELWAQTQTGTSLYLLLSDFGKDFIKRKNEVSLGA